MYIMMYTCALFLSFLFLSHPSLFLSRFLSLPRSVFLLFRCHGLALCLCKSLSLGISRYRARARARSLALTPFLSFYLSLSSLSLSRSLFFLDTYIYTWCTGRACYQLHCISASLTCRLASLHCFHTFNVVSLFIWLRTSCKQVSSVVRLCVRRTGASCAFLQLSCR